MEWIDCELAGGSEQPERRVLIEQSPAHYPEFAAFILKELGPAGGALYFRGSSGLNYRLGNVDSADPEGLEGVEICLRLPAGQADPDPQTIDEDLWPVLEWLIEGVGGEWSLDSLRKTGAIYKIPGAPRRI